MEVYNEIKIDLEILEAEKATLDAILVDFSSKAEEILQDIVNVLGDMDSVYVKNLKSLIQNLESKNSETLIANSLENAYGIGLVTEMMSEAESQSAKGVNN